MKISDKVHLNNLQLTVFALGLLLVLGMIGYFTYQTIKMEQNPPLPEVSVTYLPEQPVYTYKIKVKNKGEETATNVNLKMT